MSEYRDPYAFHALLLVYGESPADIARQLREHADAIERGEGTSVTKGADGVRLLRQGDRGGHAEEAFACRMHGVYHAEGYEPKPTALFSSAEMAERFAAGKPLYESEDDRPNVDLCVMRTDVVVSAWNSFDPDPHAQETP